MDFEKEAREIRDKLEMESDGSAIITDGCLPDLIAALQSIYDRAHRQGQEEMRERAAATCIELQAGFLSNEYSLGQPMASIGERVACRSCSDKIEALPLTPIKEEKSTPEFLPKASTKEVGIK